MPVKPLIGSEGPKITFEYANNSNVDSTQRVTNSWLLDFDIRSDTTIDETSVVKACNVFLETKLFYPRPLGWNTDPELQSYGLLWKSLPGYRQQFYGSEFKHMPTQYLNAVDRSHMRPPASGSPNASQYSGVGYGSEFSKIVPIALKVGAIYRDHGKNDIVAL